MYPLFTSHIWTPTGLPRRDRFLIVGMSANSDSKTELDTLAAGMDAFIGKPFQFEELDVVISMHNVPNNAVTGVGP